MRAALISLEDWDDVWRRNQYLASALVEQGVLRRIVFVEPPRPGTLGWQRRDVAPGITAVRPPLSVPRRLGGLRLVASALRSELGSELGSELLGGCDVLWVNDPVLGAHCLRGVGDGRPAVYDVTDDWREAGFPPRIRRRIVRAEDRLAARARTVVCSDELRRRWRERYGVEATLVPNGVDTAAWQAATPVPLPGASPHIGYIGTLHAHRLDVELVARLADDPRIGSVHLVGPSCLAPAEVERLHRPGRLFLHGPVAHDAVPAWTKAMDVLVSPHVVTPFTLSLDAIKAYEYAASGRPIVATPTSNFQQVPNARLASADTFVDAVAAAAAGHVSQVHGTAPSWQERARAFAAVLTACVDLASTGEPAAWR